MEHVCSVRILIIRLLMAVKHSCSLALPCSAAVIQKPCVGVKNYKIAHGREAQLQLGFTVQRSRYTEALRWSEDASVAPIKRMPRTPNYNGY